MTERHDLTGLQRRVLRCLATTEPRWTLTGGAALAGFHLHHRLTRDLDLFWYGRATLGEIRIEIEDRLRREGLVSKAVRSGDSFQQLRVSDGQDEAVVDLVAEPVPALESPISIEVEGVQVLLDTPYEILVNKLCALLHRSEPRDLFDVKRLVDSGVPLEQAIGDAPRKDGGFSPATLAWVLRDLPLDELARRSGFGDELGELRAFRDLLVKRLVQLSSPG